MFWYFHFDEDGAPAGAAVFCAPSIAVFSITATANLNNGSLANVAIIDDYTVPNNVTAEPLLGQAYNAYVKIPLCTTGVKTFFLLVYSLTRATTPSSRLALQRSDLEFPAPSSDLHHRKLKDLTQFLQI
jgi:hypothetical protein